MKLEKQVCTLDQAKRLKELGIKQESLFSWCGDEEQRLMDNGRDGMAVSDWVFVDLTKPANNQHADYRNDVPSARPFAAAFTVAELIQSLPIEASHPVGKQKGDLTIQAGYDHYQEKEGYTVGYFRNGEWIIGCGRDSLPVALGDLLIMILELPATIAAILDKWDLLGFTCRREAAEFILANKDWKDLVKDTVFDNKDVERVNNWRVETINQEKKKTGL